MKRERESLQTDPTCQARFGLPVPRSGPCTHYNGSLESDFVERGSVRM